MRELAALGLVYLVFLAFGLFAYNHRRFGLRQVFAVSVLTGVAIGALFAFGTGSSIVFAMMWTSFFALMLAAIVTLFAYVNRRSSS